MHLIQRVVNFTLIVITIIIGTTFLAPAHVTNAGGRPRIMPLGDSITSSKVGHASYRYWLWHQLGDAGYTVGFVGSLHGVYGGAPLYPDFDQDNEGHWGWRADEIADNITAWALTYRPDIVLLLIGSSDIEQGQSLASTIGDVETIIQRLRAVYPHITVLLGELTPTTAPYDIKIPRFNHKLVKLAARSDTKRSRVVVVDQYSGFDPNTDTWDGTHPNEAGEKILAGNWFDALAPLLPTP